MKAPKSTPASVIIPAAVDVLLVLAFVLIGRASHHEPLGGLLDTGWPFLVGLAIGWLILRAWRTPWKIMGTAIGIWLATVMVGMLLRAITGQGVQPPFIVVATVVLGLFLIGWRAIFALVIRIAGQQGARRVRP